MLGFAACLSKKFFWKLQILEQRNQKKVCFLWWVVTKFSNKLRILEEKSSFLRYFQTFRPFLSLFPFYFVLLQMHRGWKTAMQGRVIFSYEIKRLLLFYSNWNLGNFNHKKRTVSKLQRLAKARAFGLLFSLAFLGPQFEQVWTPRSFLCPNVSRIKRTIGLRLLT